MTTRRHVSRLRDTRNQRNHGPVRPLFPIRAVWLPLLAGVLMGEVAATARAANYTVDEVKRGYRASLAALDPLWMRCQFSRTWEEENAEARNVNFEGQVVAWAIDGAKFHYRKRVANRHTWFSCDGQTTWQLDYGSARRGMTPDQVECAQRQSLETKTDAALRVYITPGRWLGLYFNTGPRVQSGETVSSMLDKLSAEFIGNEEVGEHECVRINLVYRMLNGEEIPVHVWFDPGVGFLPRRIVVNWTSSMNDYVVETFRSVPSGAGGNAFLPWRMSCSNTNPEHPTNNHTDALLVEAARVGEPLEAALFRPELPEGVPVFNMDRPDERMAWQKYLARETPEERQARLEAEKKREAARLEARALPAGLEPQTPATASGGWSWSLTLLIVGVVLFALATVAFVRR